jgi:hypothetical protein
VDGQEKEKQTDRDVGKKKSMMKRTVRKKKSKKKVRSGEREG